LHCDNTKTKRLGKAKKHQKLGDHGVKGAKGLVASLLARARLTFFIFIFIVQLIHLEIHVFELGTGLVGLNCRS
jgi:hypothetical protein